jgi:hypothetical protein
VSLGNATVLYCYQLVLDYGLAGGVAQGLFGLTILIVKITFWALVSVAKKSRGIVLSLQLLITVCLFISSVALSLILDAGDVNYATFLKLYVGIVTLSMSILYPVGLCLELNETTDQNMNRLLVNPNDDQDTNPLYGSVSSSS